MCSKSFLSSIETAIVWYYKLRSIQYQTQAMVKNGAFYTFYSSVPPKHDQSIWGLYIL